MININLHHIIGIKIQNSTINIKRFINEEFYNFIQKKNVTGNIFINFKKKIIVPKKAEKIQNNFFYDSNFKTFYLKKDGQILSYNLSSYFKNKIFVNIEKNFNIWFILYIIENTIYFLISKKKICMLHGGAIKKGKSSHLILGPQGSGKTLYTLNKINEGYSFLGDEYVFLDKNAKCLSFPRSVNFKKFHKKHYKLAFTYNWNSLKIFSKIIWFFKQLIKTALLRPNWKPMIRLRLSKVYPRVRIANKTKINKIIFNFNNKKKLSYKKIYSRYPKIILKNVQFEMINRFNAIYKYISFPKDEFLRKVITDIKKLENNKIDIIKSFIYKIYKI
jgi:hypothetical protein